MASIIVTGLVGQPHSLITSHGNQGGVIAVGDAGHNVKLYKLHSEELIGLATRFTLPVRALAFSPSGTTITAAGDDEGIKLVDVAKLKVFKTLHSEAYVRALAYDPDGQYLASVTASGLLQVWDLSTGKAAMSRKAAAPKIDSGGDARSTLAWHPDGAALLAAPGRDHAVVLYERLSWEAAVTLDGGHTDRVNTLAFSCNGLYLATGGADSQLVVWDLAARSVLAQQATEGVPSQVAWHPEDGSLLHITETGAIGVWEKPVPGDRLGPCETPDRVKPGAGSGAEGSGACAGGSGC